MSHEDELRKYEIFDKYKLDPPIKFTYQGKKIEAHNFEEIWTFFWSIHDAVKISKDRNVMFNNRAIAFVNSIRIDSNLIDPADWEEELRALDNKTLQLQDIIEWMKTLDITKKNFNYNLNVQVRPRQNIESVGDGAVAGRSNLRF